MEPETIRNEKIYKEYKKGGISYRKLSYKYLKKDGEPLSPQRIQEIIKNEEQKHEQKSNQKSNNTN